MPTIVSMDTADPRLIQTLDAIGADALVSADPGVVRMLTGHYGDIETGPSVFGMPAMVVASRDAAPILVCSEDEAPTDTAVETYEGFTMGPIELPTSASDALARALKQVGNSSIRIGVDSSQLSLAMASVLPSNWIAADAELRRAVAIKTVAEIAGIKHALAVATVGQAAARATAGPGVTEFEVWAAVRSAMEIAADERCPVIVDLVSGSRTAEMGGPPTARTIAEGDLVLCDLVPRVNGLWGDSCATWSIGEPDDASVAMYEAVMVALDVGIGTLRVGVTAGKIDAVVRAVLRDAGYEYPHHTGHGLGFHWHEEPRIIPHSETVLEAGMVVALEPAAYADGRGVRVELVCAITSERARVLSTHDISFNGGSS